MKTNELEIILTAINVELKNQRESQTNLLKSNELITGKIESVLVEVTTLLRAIADQKSPEQPKIDQIPVPVVGKADLMKLNELLRSNLNLLTHQEPQEIVHKHKVAGWKGGIAVAVVLVICLVLGFKYYALRTMSEATVAKYQLMTKINPTWTQFIDSTYEVKPDDLRRYVESIATQAKTKRNVEAGSKGKRK